MKKFIKALSMIIGAIVLILIGFIIFMTISDYKPENQLEVETENNRKDIVKIGEQFTIITSNIGYGGMDEEVHFFMDGGTMSRGISKEKVINNTEELIKITKELNPDFIILQEVDVDSTRSYKVNQQEYYKDGFKDYGSVFTVNYDVPWVPIPIKEPHGKVLAGQMTLSKKEVISNSRVAMPGDMKWPASLASLDRCILISRIPVENGKELIIINGHLSAYDKGGEARKKQLDIVNNILTEEYSKGNYVIIGGDWNQSLPGTNPKAFKAQESWPEWLQEIPKTFIPNGYKWAVDEKVPSNRNTATAYKEGYNFLSVIDGFLVSDNIEIIHTETMDLKFKYTDHNPVVLNFKLK